MKQLITIGTILLFVSIILILLGSMLGAKDSKNSKSDFFVGGFIGFIPFGFGTSKTTFWIGVALTIIVVAIFVILKMNK
jgi:uncharacterized membrane protein